VIARGGRRRQRAPDGSTGARDTAIVIATFVVCVLLVGLATIASLALLDWAGLLTAGEMPGLEPVEDAAAFPGALRGSATAR
jgi:hypothetical protein